MPIVIHKTDVSPPARATLMVVEILGLEVETREVNLPSKDQYKPEYLEKNPLHTVPLLEDDGLVLSDSHAINIYLTSKYGEAQQTLYPKDVTARAIVDQRLFFDASILFPRPVIYSVVKFRAPGPTEEQVADIMESYEVAEKYLEKEFCLCDRRITNGRIIENGKKYVVYLLNSPYSENQPNAWLCGGVLVSTKHVLTSAACLTEVSHIYVIAGYKKYVSGDKIQNDECTSTRKQRIVKIVIPKAYNPSTWMQYDVGIGVVEKPYNFLDLSYRTICSYEPEAISINYNGRMEEPYSYVVALGWGAAKASKPGMVADINSEYLMQAHAIITNTSYCRKQFPQNVEYLFLCTHGLNDDFKPRVIKKRRRIISSTTSKDQRKIISSANSKNQINIVSSTTTKKKRIISSKTSSTKIPVRYVKGMWTGWRCGGNGGKEISSKDTPPECVDMDSSELPISGEGLTLNGSGTSLDKINDTNEMFNENKADIDVLVSRRQGRYFGGICQNDHGGPLIAFAGDLEVVIGVALNSVYDKKYECEGPFLYLSTARSVNLIKCLFTTDKEKRKKCNSLNYERLEYRVNWPSEQEYGQRQSTVRPVRTVQPVRPIPVRPRPNFNMGQYKRPNYNIGQFTRPTYNIGLAYKRPNYNNMGMLY